MSDRDIIERNVIVLDPTDKSGSLTKEQTQYVANCLLADNPGINLVWGDEAVRRYRELNIQLHEMRRDLVQRVVALLVIAVVIVGVVCIAPSGIAKMTGLGVLGLAFARFFYTTARAGIAHDRVVDDRNRYIVFGDRK